MTAYYNEIDPKKAAWLRELIKQGHIAPGEVDERSILDIRPTELSGFTQCHFFAGVGIWSYALRRAGWNDNRRVWTGSCPCQPFSAAGKRDGFDDERHLWPAWEWLIALGKPEGIPIYGEQVASGDGLAWFDLVSDDMEGQGNTVRAIDSCSAGFGAPHIRQRLFWMADAAGERCDRGGASEEIGGAIKFERSRYASRMADDQRSGLEGFGGNGNGGVKPGRIYVRSDGSVAEEGVIGGLADADGGNPSAERKQRSRELRQQPQNYGFSGVADTASSGQPGRRGADGRDWSETIYDSGNGISSPTNGFWRDVDWLLCRDGKWRPVEPGTFPLVNGASNRMVCLRGYGDGINAEQAAEFIKATI